MEKEHKNKKQRGGMKPDQKVSRALSHILRHGAIEQGLKISSAGYIELEEVISYLKKKGHKNVDFDTIKKVVDGNDKKRFEIDQKGHHYFIRATQGHSMKEVNTEDLLIKIENPQKYPVVIHGTFFKFWPLIKNEGLKRMTRNHIHFAPGRPKQEGVVSGMRGACDVIIQIDLFAAMKDGIQFYISSNNVILTEGVQGLLSCKYFKRVTRKNGEQIQFKQQK